MRRTIKELYPFALAEGEGVGTAYEYKAKARILAPLLARLGPSPKILVAGLPEKYGTSLDFVLTAEEIGAEIVVVDDRPAAILRATKALDAARFGRGFTAPSVSFVERPLDRLAEIGAVDLVVSCEVLQRIPRDAQRDFARSLRAIGPSGVVFVPNSENGAHLAISGLAGFGRRELADVVGTRDVGFADMPPFPPGITRSAAQRERATSGIAEAVAMRGLDAYCAAERFVPPIVARRVAHIAWARWS